MRGGRGRQTQKMRGISKPGWMDSCWNLWERTALSDNASWVEVCVSKQRPVRAGRSLDSLWPSGGRMAGEARIKRLSVYTSSPLSTCQAVTWGSKGFGIYCVSLAQLSSHLTREASVPPVSGPAWRDRPSRLGLWYQLSGVVIPPSLSLIRGGRLISFTPSFTLIIVHEGRDLIVSDSTNKDKCWLRKKTYKNLIKWSFLFFYFFLFELWI